MITQAGEPRIFEELVEGWLQDALSRGVSRFDELVTVLPGVYPGVVLEILRRLIAVGSASDWLLQSALSEVESPGRAAVGVGTSASLPIPHPVDYDWRFGETGIEYLLTEALELSSPEDTIVFLGAPSLFLAALERHYPRQIRILDANRVMTDRLTELAPAGQVTPCDILADTIPRLEGQVVVIDPPWYEEHTRAFLWAASQLCRLGGYTFMSTPPIGTRPGIAEEWARHLEWSEKLGLSLIRRETSVLPYISPPFERSALRRQGLHMIPPEWRRGDLAIFQHTRPGNSRRPRRTLAGVWDDETVLGVRIRVRRQPEDNSGDPTLLSIVPGDILPSVSRRDPRRPLVDVWTSGNRVFACRAPGVLGPVFKR